MSKLISKDISASLLRETVYMVFETCIQFRGVLYALINLYHIS